MLRKPRYLIPVAVTCFWLVMVGIFVQREGWLAPRADPPDSTTVFRPQNQGMGIYLDNGRRVGHLRLKSSEQEQDGVPGYAVALDVHLETSLFGAEARLDISGDAWSSVSGDRSDFHFVLNSGEYTMGLEGTLAEKRLQALLTTGGQETPLDFPVESPLFPGGSLGMPGAGMPILTPGEFTFIDAFDPMTMQLKPARIECVARETLTFNGRSYDTSVYTTTIGTITSKAWIGADQEIVQATTPFGFTLRILDEDQLVVPLDSDEPGDLIQSLAVIPRGEPVKIDARRMTVRVSGVDIDQIPDSPPWQRRTGDTLDIRQPELPGQAPLHPPDFDTAPFLRGDAFVAVDDPRITEQALEIAGTETDAWKQSVLLYEWVYQHIEKVPVLSVPSALDTLRTRQGDCNEHTVLYAALARSLGIPCRIAIGVVYSDTLGGFGYHAWPEVYYGGWFPVDPTLGQLAADATHIKLLNGDLGAWVQLAAFIGRLEIDVVAVE